MNRDGALAQDTRDKIREMWRQYFNNLYTPKILIPQTV